MNIYEFNQKLYRKMAWISVPQAQTNIKNVKSNFTKDR